MYWKSSEAYWTDSDRYWDNYYRSRIGTTTDRGKGINTDRDRRGAPNQGDQGIGDQGTRPNAANPDSSANR